MSIHDSQSNSVCAISQGNRKETIISGPSMRGARNLRANLSRGKKPTDANNYGTNIRMARLNNRNIFCGESRTFIIHVVKIAHAAFSPSRSLGGTRVIDALQTAVLGNIVRLRRRRRLRRRLRVEEGTGSLVCSPHSHCDPEFFLPRREPHNGEIGK
jgi:hypothetical protein